MVGFMWGFKIIFEKYLVYWYAYSRYLKYYYNCYDYYYWDNVLWWLYYKKYKILFRFWVNSNSNILLFKDFVYLFDYRLRLK